ncbi:MAG: phosphoribosylanthranilate isomerase [Verrucomicrobiota bacterium]|nr:phosphoribosylanthranilate isomerase [Verrucomicrobiota bacterium]
MFHERESGRGLFVKICGITNAADAAAAVDLGADAIGLNCFRGSRRFLDLEAARDWISELPPELAKIAVVVNPTASDVAALAAYPFIDGLQLHGQETPEFCQTLSARGIRFSKALPVTDENSLDEASRYSTSTFVLDSESGGVFGGSGRTFRWEIAAQFVAAHPSYRVILAGGLTPKNVEAAVTLVRPFGVDVTSGVEAIAGRKDHGRLRAFIDAARSV